MNVSRESGRGRRAWTPALFLVRSYLPGASILCAQRMNVSGHLRVYLYSVCDAKSRSSRGEEEGVWGGEGRRGRPEGREEKREESERQRERENVCV